MQHTGVSELVISALANGLVFLGLSAKKQIHVTIVKSGSFIRERPTLCADKTEKYGKLHWVLRKAPDMRASYPIK